jgi:hypothetical protein
MSVNNETSEYYNHTGNNTCFWIKIKTSGEVIISHYNNVSSWRSKNRKK